MSKTINVILTGGVGSRLWPLSRKNKPKQYLQLFDDCSLFELTVKRNLAFSDQIIVVGNVQNQHLSKDAMQKLEVDYINIVESVPRNTAAAIAFAAFAADADDILLVSPSDQMIRDTDLYQNTVASAIKLAKEDVLVTFGITPSKPETGYGYIEFNDEEVISFREKPTLDQAIQFIQQNTFLWNSGMFCFKAGVYLTELKRLNETLFDTSEKAWNNAINNHLDLEDSMNIPSISIDYAVMEKTNKIKVVKSHFDWTDLGSFEALYDYLVSAGHQVDSNGNMVIGTNIYTEFLGLKDTIFVYTEDAFLILNKNESQKVKDIYNSLESGNSHLIN